MDVKGNKMNKAGWTGVAPYRMADGFPEGMGRIPNNPLVAAGLAAIFKGGPMARHLVGGWSVGAGGGLFYRHVGKRGGEIHVRLEGSEEGLEEQWRFVEGLRVLTADVLVGVLAQLCEPGVGSKSKYPLLTPVAITANALLKYKGTSCWGKERSELRGSIVEEMRRLQRLRFDVHQYPAWDPGSQRWNARGVSVLGDKVFDVTEVGVRRSEGARCLPSVHRTLDPNMPVACSAASEGYSDVAWLVRIGHWGQWWLNAQAKVWLGPAPLSLLRFDHRRNRGAEVLAKKIGMNTLMLWGVARSLTSLERRIDHLLQDIGELPVAERQGPHWAGRTRDRFDEALLRLREAGTLAAVEWPKGLMPGDTDRAKGWVARWLSSKVSLQLTPEAMEEGGAKPAGASRTVRPRWRGMRKPKPKALAPASAGVENLRSLRTDRGLSQVQLARELGISPAYLSQIETGRKLASHEILQRLHGWASLPGVEA